MNGLEYGSNAVDRRTVMAMAACAMVPWPDSRVVLRPEARRFLVIWLNWIFALAGENAEQAWTPDRQRLASRMRIGRYRVQLKAFDPHGSRTLDILGCDEDDPLVGVHIRMLADRMSIGRAGLLPDYLLRRLAADPALLCAVHRVLHDASRRRENDSLTSAPA